MTDMLLHATNYTRDGCSVIPVPFRSKNPGFDGWQNMRLTEDELPVHFNGKPQNIGLLLGTPSDNRIDIDLDHPKAVELAPQYLPPTPAVFGRPGKPRSHLLYKVTSPIRTKQFRLKKVSIVEIRSTGLQTVVPPSMHENGEPITWENEGAVPAKIDPAELREAVQRLYDAVVESLNEEPARAQQNVASDSVEGSNESAAWKRALQKMLRIKVADGKDGSRRLLAVACRAVEHDLKDDEAIRCIRACERQRPFPKQWSDDDIVKRLRSAEGKCTRAEALQRINSRVILGADEHRVSDETIKAMSADPDLYQRGGILTRVFQRGRGRHGSVAQDHAIVIQVVPEANLRDRISKFTNLVQVDSEGAEHPAHPPPWLVSAVDARGHWPGIRELVGATAAPFLRSDGSICQTPGYDDVSGVLYVPRQSFPVIPEELTIDHARSALHELVEVVCDFRFESPEHQAAWLAGLLTPAARYAFEGPSPLFLVDANVRGAGKGLLVQSIGRIVLGHTVPVSAFVADPDEMRKQITSIAMAGDLMVLLDNLNGPLGNDALDRALTSTRWKDRLLGTNKNIDLPLYTTFYATGNNVVVGADTIRRIIHIRLDVLDEHPEHRRDFRHPDLLAWIAPNGARLLSAVLTILAAYCRAGRPKQDLQSFGSFEGWSDLVRQSIVWLGQPDPCASRVKLAEKCDTVAETLAQIIEAWGAYDPQNRGLAIAPLVRELYTGQRDLLPQNDASDTMRAALENLVGTPPGITPDPRKIGNRLKSFRRRVSGVHYLDVDDTQRRNGAVWRLQEVTNDQTA